VFAAKFNAGDKLKLEQVFSLISLMNTDLKYSMEKIAACGQAGVICAHLTLNLPEPSLRFFFTIKK